MKEKTYNAECVYRLIAEMRRDERRMFSIWFSGGKEEDIIDDWRLDGFSLDPTPEQKAQWLLVFRDIMSRAHPAWDEKHDGKGVIFIEITSGTVHVSLDINIKQELCYD